jgi:hypothetical protein
MGLVCCSILADPSRTPGEPTPEIILWGHSDDEVSGLAQTRKSKRLSGFKLPDGVRVTDSDVALEGADLVVSAIPVQFTRDVWLRLRPHVPAGAGVVSAALAVFSAGAGAHPVITAAAPPTAAHRRTTSVSRYCFTASGSSRGTTMARQHRPTSHRPLQPLRG